MSKPTDSLIYSSIQNTIDDDNEINKIIAATDASGNSKTEKINSINDILDKTTMKRACCMNKKTINVRIPIPNGSSVDNLNQKFGYYEKTIEIPDGFCNQYLPGYTNGSEVCNNFYNAYCSNIRDIYIKANNNKFSQSEFSLYKPECACYGLERKANENASYTISPKCYMIGCKAGESNVYLDPTSRKEECNQTICNIVNNFSDIQAGGNVEFEMEFSQACGGRPNTGSGGKSGTGGTSGTGSNSGNGGSGSNGGSAGNGSGSNNGSGNGISGNGQSGSSGSSGPSGPQNPNDTNNSVFSKYFMIFITIPILFMIIASVLLVTMKKGSKYKGFNVGMSIVASLILITLIAVKLLAD